MAKKRFNIKLNIEDTYFLNNLKNRRQWLDSKDCFDGKQLSEDEWYMISDYLFRLAMDYTAYANNKKMHDNKKKERISNIKRCAEEILKMAGLTVKECEIND